MMQKAAFLRPTMAGLAALALFTTGIACSKGAEEESGDTAGKTAGASPPAGPMVAPRNAGMAGKTGAPATRGGGGGMPTQATNQAP